MHAINRAFEGDIYSRAVHVSVLRKIHRTLHTTVMVSGGQNQKDCKASSHITSCHPSSHCLRPSSPTSSRHHDVPFSYI